MTYDDDGDDGDDGKHFQLLLLSIQWASVKPDGTVSISHCTFSCVCVCDSL